MKKIKGILILLLFAVSCCALFWLTGSRTPWTIFQQPDKTRGITVHLGDIPVENYDRMGFTKGQVQYVEPEDGWLVGTDRGELFLFGQDGSQRWKRSLGVGKLVSLTLSPDGKTAYVGEVSAEGNLYAVDIHSGDIRWKYKGADYAGADASQRSYPSVVHIVCDREGNVYANIYRFLMDKEGHRGYNGRMISVNPEGGLRWQFPKNEVIDSWINWCDVSDGSGTVVLSTSAYDFRPEMKYKATMYFIDKDTGDQVGTTTVAPIPPFDNTVMRGSPNFSADGRYLAASASDGRGFLFTGDGKLLWERTLSKPTQVDGAWLNASGRDGFALKEGVLFTTINTFNRENWQLPTPVEHPSNNSLFLFGTDGTYKFQYMAPGTMEDLAFAKHYVACAVGRNVRTHNYKAHGGLLVDLETGRAVSSFHTEGPCQAIALNRDATLMAGVEAPALTPEGKIIGAYRLHIWKVAEGAVPADTADSGAGSGNGNAAGGGENSPATGQAGNNDNTTGNTTGNYGARDGKGE